MTQSTSIKPPLANEYISNTGYIKLVLENGVWKSYVKHIGEDWGFLEVVTEAKVLDLVLDANWGFRPA